MMTEPKCVLWKRLGAEKIQEQIKGMSLSEELEFWRKQTEKFKLAEQIAKNKLPKKSKQQTPVVLRYNSNQVDIYR